MADRIDPPAVPAIPTKYNGLLYRSRTEARWAAFFDAAGISFEYEPEGYMLPSGHRYLIDFHTPKLAAFWEVKGSEPTPTEKLKALELSELTGKRVWFLVGTPDSGLNQVQSRGLFGTFLKCGYCGAISIGDKDGQWGMTIQASDCRRCSEKDQQLADALNYARNQRFGVHE